MFKLLVFVALLACVHSQDANSIANFIRDTVTNYFQTSELVKLETKIAEQICSGASLQEVFDNFKNTVMQCIGGATAMNMLGLVSKLSHDLGDNFGAVKDAASNAVANSLQTAINDASQYCGEGTDSVLAHGAQYVSNEFVKSLFDQVYWGISAVDGNAWTICRNDLAAHVYFENFGY